MKYRVTKGIFENHEFNGSPIIINGEERIWDDDSVGNSYPKKNCEKINTVNLCNGTDSKEKAKKIQEANED